MKSSGRIGPGASTILMILVVLVMTMLGVLSLFSARSDMEMSERTSAAAAEYYAAQTDFSLWLQETDQILENLRIASGGELARIMLALKNVLAEQESIGTLVFDEVDTGVSGRAAQKVAEKLAQVSRRKQVLCVTHLPQLAAMADTHFSVEKGERDGRTYTRVVLLDREQRKAELARITGGSRVTEALLASAGELLDQAERYRSELGMRNHAE